MRAEELRIGNWLHYAGFRDVDPDLKDKVFQVIPDTITHLLNCPDTDWIEPVLLTEEWLLKFGFTAHNQDNRDPVYWIDDEIFQVFKENGLICHDYAHNGGIKIRYVHQLQNLYFALTNEELIIKL